MDVHNLVIVIRIVKGIKAAGIVFGEHFYGGGEFFVEGRDETIWLVSYRLGKLDLISVQCQSLDKRLFGLVLGKTVVCLEIGQIQRSAATI